MKWITICLFIWATLGKLPNSDVTNANILPTLTGLNTNLDVSKLIKSSKKYDFPKPKEWPSRFNVTFNVSVPLWRVHDYPSKLTYDWVNKRQRVWHQKCPIFSNTECVAIFGSNGSYVIDNWAETVYPCCKVMNHGCLFPNLFSDYGTFGGFNTIGGQNCSRWDIFDHGSLYITVATGMEVSFESYAFPAYVGTVWWNFTQPFKDVWFPFDDELFHIPKLCAPTCGPIG